METTAGEVLGPLAHQVRHSPTGFAWGYDGSGPADLASSLLAAALGDRAHCSACGGSGQVVADPDGTLEVLAYDPTAHESTVDPALVEHCGGCHGDGLDTDTVGNYQAFKRDVVARLSREWWIFRGEVLDWLTSGTQPAASRQELQ